MTTREPGGPAAVTRHDESAAVDGTGRPAWSTASLLFDVFVASQAVGSLVDDALDGSPLDATGYAVCSAVFDEEALTPTTLARRLGMPLTTAIDHVRSLERRGFLARRQHPADGRSFQVVLTADGMAAHRAASGRFEVGWQRFSASLDLPPEAVRTALAAITAAATAARHSRAES